MLAYVVGTYIPDVINGNFMYAYRVYVTFVGQKTQCAQIYTKLTQFEDNDSSKLLVLRCCSFWEMSKTMS